MIKKLLRNHRVSHGYEVDNIFYLLTLTCSLLPKPQKFVAHHYHKCYKRFLIPIIKTVGIQIFGEGRDRFWVTCRNIIVAFFISAQITMLAAQPAQAEPAEGSLANRPQIPKNTECTNNLPDFQNPPLIPLAENGNIDLTVDYYTNGTLYNPATCKDDNVSLRYFKSNYTDSDRPYIGPTIEAKPGDTIVVNLNNELEEEGEDTCPETPNNVNVPHCFNTTNLHTHGWWVSPNGNSDNVLTKIEPGDDTFKYEYKLPPEHPAGTFWYHPHVHGSTALQVSSGMAGALIVRGDRLPTETANGDIDTLLGSDVTENILVFQQIPYYCPKSEGSENIWNCDGHRDEIGEIETYDYDFDTEDPKDDISIFGPGTWDESGRYTSINGEIWPKFSAEAGEIQRWRMIHAGVRDTINLEFRKIPGISKKSLFVNPLPATENDSFISQICTEAPIPYHVIADDGLTRDKAFETTLTTLQPGYRKDALVVFPEQGNYCVINSASNASDGVTGKARTRRLLGIVEVQGGQSIMEDIHDYLKNDLVVRADQLSVDHLVKDKVVADLNNDLMLTKFIDHEDLNNLDYGDINGHQELAFNIDTSATPTKFQVSNGIGINKPYDPQPYDPEEIPRILKLDTVDEWTLESRFVSHPFHIHVNPFQIVEIIDHNGNDVSLPDATDGGDPQYRGLKGVWKDTLWIKGPSNGSSRYTIVVRTKYERYPGTFVLHCHILDHEDQGMMQNVCITGNPDTPSPEDCTLPTRD